MKQQIVNKIMVAAAMLIALTSASYGQISTTMVFDAPFAFHAAGAVLPAGEYRVTPGIAANTVMIRSTDGRNAAFVLYSPGESAKKQPTELGLRFQHFGSTYLLTEMWIGTQGAVVNVPKRDRAALARAPLARRRL